MDKTKTLLMICGLLALAACKADKAPTDAAPATPETVASAEAPVADPNAINDAIATDAFKVRLAVNSAPKAAANGNGMEIAVDVVNQGSAPIYGVGAKPVNLGIQILGVGDDVSASGGVRDFMRTPLPLITPGASATVLVNVPVDSRIDGRKLRISVVQEAVGWHDDSAESRQDVGPFKICNERICDEAGVPLAP